MYAFELLALAAVFRPPRRLAAWLLFLVSAFGMTVLGLVVPNVGALYRFRYTFWVLIIVLGAKGFEAAAAEYKRRRGRSLARAAAGVATACLLAVACGCSSRAGSDGGPALAESRAQGVVPASATAGGMSLDLTNLTGSKLRAIYVSPSDSKGWEENVLGGDELNDGEVLGLRFSPEETAARWDIRVEAADEHCAEWKGLELRGASRITLLLSVVGKPAAVAEVE